jgi:hypothetical protein
MELFANSKPHTGRVTGRPGGNRYALRQSGRVIGAGAPVFALWAARDPDAVNLDRIQVVKGWSKDGQSFEQVYDVAWSGERSPDSETGKLSPVESTVDLNTGTYTNTVGEPELMTLWTDPDFDPSLEAFYYARVLEIPTPRWSTIQAVAAGRMPSSGEGYTEMAGLLHGGAPNYHIKGSSLITQIAGTPLKVTVCRLGDKYLAAHREEYGFVNYDVTPVKE